MLPVSVCMIAKNEDIHIEECLKRLRPCKFEIIVVDTGSVDRTMETARKYTDKVFHFDWCDDFSAARNFCVSHASNNWILALDCDEYVHSIDVSSLRRIMQQYPRALGEIQMKSLVQSRGVTSYAVDVVRRFYNKNYYTVLNAYGIKGRAPAASEIAFIKRWYEEYGFTSTIIIEAVNRTMDTIHQPSFDYTESILKRWFEKGVHNPEDIIAVDSDYLKAKEQKAMKRENVKLQKSTAAGRKQSNKFNNFDSRSYDMDDLERRLLQQ